MKKDEILQYGDIREIEIRKTHKLFVTSWNLFLEKKWLTVQKKIPVSPGTTTAKLMELIDWLIACLIDLLIDWLIYGVSRGCSIHAVELLTQRIKQILEKKENKSVVNSILGNLNIKQFKFMNIWKIGAQVPGGKITTKTCKIKAITLKIQISAD